MYDAGSRSGEEEKEKNRVGMMPENQLLARNGYVGEPLLIGRRRIHVLAKAIE